MSNGANNTDDERAGEKLYGGPTKRFFVSMLTRDIALSDAILDLVDNCVDGAMRQRKKHLRDPKPFEGFEAKLSINSKTFEISDNCGGIPEDYVEDAFSLGRPNIQKDGDLPTIGMYGIGMKRAIFKIGSEAYVDSNSADGYFEVEYSQEWLAPDNDHWNLPIKREPAKDGDTGVTIRIPTVKNEIGKHFDNDSFLTKLKNELSEHFGYLMQRGFAISLNGELLAPRTLLLFSEGHSAASAIRPYDFEATVDGVLIKAAIGFFRPLVREEEIDEELSGSRQREAAGISVVCNDRVVLLNDRTIKTGWGDGGVPRFHPQFRAIAGIVVFYSTDAEKLPISTTKRDLDAGSEVFLRARQAVMEGLKIFTDFTNKWKGMEDETSRYFEATKRTDARSEIALARSPGGTTIRGGRRRGQIRAKSPSTRK